MTTDLQSGRPPGPGPLVPDPADAVRRLPGWLACYGALIALFHLWANTLGTLPTLWLNSLHLALVGSFGGLMLACEATSTATRVAGRVAALVLLAGGLYLLPAEEWLHRRGVRLVAGDFIVAAATIGAAWWLCGRRTGWVIPVLGLLVSAYVLGLGRHLDGVLHFRGLGVERLLYRFYFSEEGLFGFTATISATFVFLFLLFSAFLLRSGAGEFILQVARAATRNLRGGPGYVAVVSSALTGTVSGSAIANTVSTGSITIPMMKRAGFPPAFAAGLETAASVGGQLMPPIMGAGAFLMAQYTGLSYLTIIGAALLPALLYFLSLMVAVRCQAARLPAPDKTTPQAAPAAGANAADARRRRLRLWRQGLAFLLPLAVVIGVLVAGFTPTFAAGTGIVAVLAASWFRPGGGMGWRAIGEALALGTRNAVPTALLLLCTGIVIGGLNMTGAAVGISQMVIAWSGGWLPAALVLTALASLILGMGLPVTAAYVMLAVVAVPALEELGLSLLAAHLLLFWWSQDSNVTPPVCLAAFAAAGIAECRPLAAGVQAWRLAKALYLVPLLFVFTPLIDGTPSERLLAALPAAAGLVAFTVAFAGGWRGARERSMPVPVRLAWAAAGVALFVPATGWQLAGAAGLALLIVSEAMPSRRARETAI